MVEFLLIPDQPLYPAILMWCKYNNSGEPTKAINLQMEQFEWCLL